MTWTRIHLSSGDVEYRYRFWPVPAYRLAAWLDHYLIPEYEHRRGMRLWGWLRGHGLLRLEKRPIDRTHKQAARRATTTSQEEARP